LIAAPGQPDNPIVLAGEALANPLTGAYSVTIGHYVNPQPAGSLNFLAPGSYNVTAIQYDVAGNASTPKSFGNIGAVVLDGTDANDLGHGDNFGPGGTNEGGWLYMQKVLQLIQPNVTNGSKVLVALGADPTSSIQFGFGAAAAINSAFVQSPLP